MSNHNENPTEVAIKELTLALLYLTRFGDRHDQVLRTSWLEYDRDATRELIEENLLLGRSRYQTHISDEGLMEAQRILEKYQIPDWD